MNLAVAAHDLDCKAARPRSESGDRAPLRVLHVLSRFATGGMERIVLQLTRSLEGGIFEHRLAALRGADPALDQSQLPGGRLLIEGRDDTGFEFLVFRLAKAMRAYRPHIVHSRNWGAIESIPAARLAGVPIAVHTEHGYELDMLAGLPKRRRVFRRVAYAMADAVTVVTYDLRDFHARQAWVPPESIRVIYDGIDTERFRPRPGKSAELRKRFNLPGHRFIVGTVGRMVPIKDHPTLLRAVEILVRRGIDAHAVVVGSGPELEHNQQLASHSPALADRVTFTGASDDVPELLNTMDAFALTSISEGMCNSLLEAMATGLPVIATRVGGNPELIEEGRTGWLFRLGDAEVLAERLALLIGEGDRRSECGTAARQRVVERFSLKRMLQNYSELYLELARQRGIRMAR